MFFIRSGAKSCKSCKISSDLVKSFQTNTYFQKIGFDTAENGPLKACQNLPQLEEHLEAT